MKSFSLGLLIVTCLLLASPALAQSITQADVPFDFMIGKQVFPAGHYSMEYRNGFVAVRDANGHASNFLVNAGRTAEPNTASKWVFAENGGSHYLLQVGFGESFIAELPTARQNDMATTNHVAAKAVEVTAGTK